MTQPLTQNSPDPSPFKAMVFAASGGIGQAMVLEILKQHPEALVYRFARNLTHLTPKSSLETTRPGQILDVFWDLNAPEVLAETLTRICQQQQSAKLKVDLIFVASGFLHDETQQPEKTYQQLKADNLMRSFAMNAVGPVMVLQTLLQHLDLKHPCKMGVLSARVGSISDNRMGGWHSYRASKAALNMLLKNLAIELQRKRLPITLVGLQPGTTDTELSKPFTKNLAPNQLQTPAFTAERLYQVLNQLTPEDSGQLFDFEGERFEP